MLKHYVKLFEMGSSHIQPAWESNNNNKKKWRGGGGVKALLLPFLSAGAEGLGSEEGPLGRAVRGRAGAAGAVGAVPCGGGTSAALPSLRSLGLEGRGWDGGVGTREGGRRSRRRLLRYLCGPRPGPGPRADGGGSFLGSPRTRLPPLRRV